MVSTRMKFGMTKGAARGREVVAFSQGCSGQHARCVAQQDARVLTDTVP
jgi:hypothetical protein